MEVKKIVYSYKDSIF